MFNNQGGFQSYDQGGGQGFNSPGGFGTPQQSQEKRQTRQRAQNIIPVTVSEVINTTMAEEKFMSQSGDMEILQVTLVGLVRAVKESAVKIEYEIDDMTGPPLEVRQFVDNDESVPEEERVQAMRENSYVRVTGTVRSFKDMRNITAFKVSPVKDMNELTHHILDVIHSHASLAANPAVGSSTNGNVTNTNSSMMGTNYDSGDSGAISGLTAIQNQVHVAIRNNPTAEGASLDSVFKQIRGVPEKAIRDAVEFLSGEGHIYSTVDDDHFKATDS